MDQCRLFQCMSILYHLVATDDKKKIQCLNVVLNKKNLTITCSFEIHLMQRHSLWRSPRAVSPTYRLRVSMQEKTYPASPPPPALGPCFALVNQVFFFSIYYPDDYEVDVCFSLSHRIKLYYPWVLARQIRLDKLILPKNKCCLAHVSFSVADRRCPTPEIPFNGRVRGTNTTFGSVIKYRCSSSYKLQGPKKRTCRGNGKWDGETPICS